MNEIKMSDIPIGNKMVVKGVGLLIFLQ